MIILFNNHTNKGMSVTGIKVIAINSNVVSGGGKVFLGISKYAQKYGFDYRTYSPIDYAPKVDGHNYFSSKFEHALNTKFGMITGFDNAFFILGTMRLLRIIKRLKPNVIHLHGLHNWYLNYNLLLKELFRMNIPVVWTHHDCWGYTGKCPSYSAEKCEKWKETCDNCPQRMSYPKSLLVDNSSWMHKFKKQVFLGYTNLYLTTVSNWISHELESSFLKNYPVTVIENGIDVDLFKYRVNNLRDEYNLGQKKIILSVASGWSVRKGLNDIFELSNALETSDIQDYQIVVIGVNEDQKIECIRRGILGLDRTDNIQGLIDWYSTADIFLNFSVAESFGLVTVEALSCGLPVIAYDTTATPEILEGTDCFVLRPGDVSEVIGSLQEVFKNGRDFYSERCRNVVLERYNCDKQYQKYLELYSELADEYTQ